MTASSNRYRFSWPNVLLAQNFLHRFSFRELINQLVQIANFLHQRIVDFFNANAAHNAFDERTIWMNGRCLSKKGFEIVFFFDLLLQSLLGIAGQPANDPRSEERRVGKEYRYR